MLEANILGYWSDGSLSTTFEVSDTGTYFAEILYGIGLSRSELIIVEDIIDTCIAGIQEHNQKITVLPNPTGDFVKVVSVI
jgi:hypothetical protein